MAEKESKAPVVRIQTLAGKVFSLPHAGNEEAGGVFEVDEDGIVFATDNDIQTVEETDRETGKKVKVKRKVGRKRVPLTEAQAEAIVRLRHLDGASLVE